MHSEFTLAPYSRLRRVPRFAPNLLPTRRASVMRATVATATTEDTVHMAFSHRFSGVVAQIAIHHTATVLVTEPNGEMSCCTSRIEAST